MGTRRWSKSKSKRTRAMEHCELRTCTLVYASVSAVAHVEVHANHESWLRYLWLCTKQWTISRYSFVIAHHNQAKAYGWCVLVGAPVPQISMLHINENNAVVQYFAKMHTSFIRFFPLLCQSSSENVSALLGCSWFAWHEAAAHKCECVRVCVCVPGWLTAFEFPMHVWLFNLAIVHHEKYPHNLCMTLSLAIFWHLSFMCSFIHIYCRLLCFHYAPDPCLLHICQPS